MSLQTTNISIAANPYLQFSDWMDIFKVICNMYININKLYYSKTEDQLTKTSYKYCCGCTPFISYYPFLFFSECNSF